jgi:hypothetical protein
MKPWIHPSHVDADEWPTGALAVVLQLVNRAQRISWASARIDLSPRDHKIELWEEFKSVRAIALPQPIVPVSRQQLEFTGHIARQICEQLRNRSSTDDENDTEVDDSGAADGHESFTSGWVHFPRRLAVWAQPVSPLSARSDSAGFHLGEATGIQDLEQ